VVAGGLGVLFGLTRGLAVLLAVRSDRPAQLRDLHRRIEKAREPVRRAVIGCEGAVAAVGAAALAGVTPAIATASALAVIAVGAGAVATFQRTVLVRERRSG
jgi:hypothetical protein